MEVKPKGRVHVKKVMGRLLKIALALAGLYVLAVVLTIYFTLMPPKYKPTPDIYLVPQRYGDEIIEIYNLMVDYAGAQGTLYTDKEYDSRGFEEWDEAIYAKVISLRDTMAADGELGNRMPFEISFFTARKGTCSLSIEIDANNRQFIVDLIYYPHDNPFEGYKPLDGLPHWYYYSP